MLFLVDVIGNFKYEKRVTSLEIEENQTHLVHSAMNGFSFNNIFLFYILLPFWEHLLPVFLCDV